MELLLVSVSWVASNVALQGDTRYGHWWFLDRLFSGGVHFGSSRCNTPAAPGTKEGMKFIPYFS